jgi:hypothetical protein
VGRGVRSNESNTLSVRSSKIGGAQKVPIPSKKQNSGLKKMDSVSKQSKNGDWICDVMLLKGVDKGPLFMLGVSRAGTLGTGIADEQFRDGLCGIAPSRGTDEGSLFVSGG